MAIDEYKTGNPARQGFYQVRTDKGEKHIAEWRKYDKETGPRWWIHTSENPTIAKKPVALTDVSAYAKAEEQAVTAALQRTPTREESIQASLGAYYGSLESRLSFHMDIPPTRRLSVGQSVTVGRLRDPKIAAVHDEGQVVTLEYRVIEVKSGTEIDKGITFGTWHWLEVLPDIGVKPKNLAVVPAFRAQVYFNTRLEQLIRRMYRDGVCDSPEYQRDYVWTLDDKQRYLETLFTGRDLGRFIFIKEQYPLTDVLFDGKQRMNTLLELISSQLTYQGIYWHEMSKGDRNEVLGRSVQFAELDTKQFSKADLLDVFLDVNAAGVPQTEEHLAKVRAMRDAERATEAALKV